MDTAQRLNRGFHYSLMQKALAAAEKVARYRHAQLSAVRLAGDISGKMDDVSLDELLVTIKRTGEARPADRPGPQPVIVITGRGESIASNRERERTGGDFAAAPSAAGVGVELTALCRALGGRWRGLGALTHRGARPERARCVLVARRASA